MTVEFVLPLPYRIPVGLPRSFQLQSSDGWDIELRLDVKRSDYRIVNFYQNASVVDQQDITIVDATIKILQTEKKEIELIREAFDAALDSINLVLSGLRAQSDILHIEPIKPGSLPMIVPVIVGDERRSFVTNPNKMYDDNYSKITDAAVQEGFQLVRGWAASDSIDFPSEYFYEARSDIINGRFRYAVVNLQTSFEICVNKLLRFLLRKEGVSKEKIEAIISLVPFMRKVKHELKNHLVPDFDPIKCIEYQNWKQYLYDVRNKIVHEGYATLTKADGYNALRAYCHFHNYLQEKLVTAGHKTVPHTVDFGSLQKDASDPVLLKKISAAIGRIP